MREPIFCLILNLIECGSLVNLSSFDYHIALLMDSKNELRLLLISRPRFRMISNFLAAEFGRFHFMSLRILASPRPSKRIRHTLHKSNELHRTVDTCAAHPKHLTINNICMCSEYGADSIDDVSHICLHSNLNNLWNV